MDITSRKAAIAAYKERSSAFGVFAIICTATGQVWVGQSRHLDTQKNGLWFSLKHGSNPYAALQAAWDLHGSDAFRFEELDRLRDDFPASTRPAELRRRQSIWAARLRASTM